MISLSKVNRIVSGDNTTEWTNTNGSIRECYCSVSWYGSMRRQFCCYSILLSKNGRLPLLRGSSYLYENYVNSDQRRFINREKNLLMATTKISDSYNMLYNIIDNKRYKTDISGFSIYNIIPGNTLIISRHKTYENRRVITVYFKESSEIDYFREIIIAFKEDDIYEISYSNISKGSMTSELNIIINYNRSLEDTIVINNKKILDEILNRIKSDYDYGSKLIYGGKI